MANAEPTNQISQKPAQKRILIARQPAKEETPKPIEKPQEAKVCEPKQEPAVYINPHDQKPIIKEEDV